MTTMVEVIGRGRHGATAARPGTKVAAERASVAKNIALFFAAPWIGLAYLIVFPVVGMVALVKLGVRALA